MMKGFTLLLLCSLFSDIQSFALNCSCGIHSYSAVFNESVYSCYVNNLKLSLYSGPVTNIVVRAYELKSTNADVKLIKIHNQTCEEIPEKIGRFFINIEGIEIISSELKVIKKSSLEELKNIKYLNFMKNEVETLARDLFENNQMLQVVIICCNKLKVIGLEIFDHLHDIQHVDLRRNICISQKSENKENLKIMKKEIEKKCPPSIEVYCTYGDVDFPVGSFYTCEVRFWIVVIDYMTVSNFQGRQSGGKKNYNVNGLKLTEMTTKYLPINLCKHFRRLEAIEVVGGKMARLEQRDIKPFPHLKVLWLPRNNIESLSSDVFEENTKLEKISFYQNRLQFIGSEVLTPLKSLQFISFEFNECIDQYAFSLICMEKLEKEINNNCQL